MSIRRNTGLVILLLILSSNAALGHNPVNSWAVARFYGDRMELDVELASESAWLFSGGSAASPPDVSSVLPKLKAQAVDLYRVYAAGVELKPRSVNIELREEDGVGFMLVYPRPVGEPLRFEAAFLQKLPTDHRTTLTLKDETDKVIRTEVLTVANPMTEMAFSPNVSFWAFLKLGVEHILTGYDHLLFLCGLLVACRRFSSMALIITCFTLAHTLTLALAALDVVTISSRIVEPLIAATIVFVGIENLWRRDEPKGRWVLTLIFGLIHGFGFAERLKEIGLGSTKSSLLISLFSFNLGVELGQLAVAAIFVPLLWQLRKLPTFARYDRPTISALVIMAGVFWLVQRLFFS